MINNLLVAGIVLLTLVMIVAGLWVFDIWWTNYPVGAVVFISIIVLVITVVVGTLLGMVYRERKVKIYGSKAPKN